MKVLGIIPARYASTRLPGKPLVDIAGRPMIQHVYERALQSAALTDLVVATDHPLIVDAVTEFGGQVQLTSEHHPSGTDRCAEVLTHATEKYDIVINIQGDEPLIDPRQIDQVVACFEGIHVQIATLIKKIESQTTLFDPNAPKVVIDHTQKALYFSRQPVPYLRGYPEAQWMLVHAYYKHIGIYGFRSDVLQKLTQLPPSPLEQAESLEQLRWLENGYVIQTAITDSESKAIDTPEDLDEVRALLG